MLLHGRGADEHDLFPLLDALDPERRLQGYTPRAPLSLPPGGAHWYVVPRVGYPDPETFREGYARADRVVRRAAVPAGADRARRLLAGRRDELRARPRQGAAAPARAASRSAASSRPSRAGSPTSSRRSRRSRSRTARTTPSSPSSSAGEARDVLEAAGADVLYRESPIEPLDRPAGPDSRWSRGLIALGSPPRVQSRRSTCATPIALLSLLALLVALAAAGSAGARSHATHVQVLHRSDVPADGARVPERQDHRLRRRHGA